MKKFFIFLINLYRYLLSPILPMSCRFTPTCSEYSITAINKYGILKGIYLTFRRLLKCHPLHSGGYDPLK